MNSNPFGFRSVRPAISADAEWIRFVPILPFSIPVDVIENVAFRARWMRMPELIPKTHETAEFVEPVLLLRHRKTPEGQENGVTRSEQKR